MPTAVEDGNSSSNGNTSNNNNANGEDTRKPNMDQKMWNVLKAYIIRDRARKKQEREAEVEEERLRKEREAREQEDVMTLGETREKISQFEVKLQSLKDEKHLLFIQLKKVLNDDDTRRKQQMKDANEQQQQQMMMLLPQGIAPHQAQSIYMSQPSTGRIQTIAQQAHPSLPPAAYKPAVKRPRSPISPPSQVPVSLYHQGYTAYKPPTIAVSSYQGGSQKDDGRHNELVRAVLWNKTPQYSSQPSAFYPVGPQDIPLCYPRLARDSGRPVYDQPVRPQGFQIDHKLPEHYTTIRTAPSQYSHVIHPGPGLVMNASQGVPKGGSITAGYPVRTQPEYQQAGPASLYTTQSRQMYQNYTQRE